MLSHQSTSHLLLQIQMYTNKHYNTLCICSLVKIMHRLFVPIGKPENRNITWFLCSDRVQRICETNVYSPLRFSITYVYLCWKMLSPCTKLNIIYNISELPTSYNTILPELIHNIIFSCSSRNIGHILTYVYFISK